MIQFFTIVILLIASLSYSQTKGWKQLPAPSLGSIIQIEISKNGDIYALTSPYALFHYSNNYWRPLTTFPSTNNYYAAISLDPEGNIFLFNMYSNGQYTVSGILRSTDNGVSWIKVLNTSYINRICYSPTAMYAFQGGQYSSQTVIFRSTNHGSTWDTLTSIPLGSNDFTVNSADQCFFSLSSPETSIVRYDPATNLYKVITTDENSSPFSLPTLSCCDGQVLVRSGNEEFVVNGNTLKKRADIAIPYPGKNHSAPQYYSPFNKKLYTITLTDTLLKEGGYWIYSSDDLGVTWHKCSSIPTAINAFAQLGIDSIGNIYFGNYNYVPGNKETGKVYRSSDNGNSWKTIGLSTSSPSSLQEGPKQLIYMNYTAGNSYFPSVSLDKGASWSDFGSVFPLFNNNPYGHFFKGFDSSEFYFHDGLYFAPKDSFTFTKQSPFIAQNLYPFRNNLFALTFNISDYYLYVSTDSGVSWDELGRPSTGTPISASTMDKNGSIYLGYTPGLYRSDTEGKNWIKMSTGLKNATINLILIPDSTTIILGLLNSGIWHSTDAGVTWSKWNPALFDTVTDIEIYHDKCYAATSKGLISCSLTSNNWHHELLADEQYPITKLLNHSSGTLYATGPNIGLWINDPNFVDVKTASDHLQISSILSITSNGSQNVVSFSIGKFDYATISLYDILGHKLQIISEGNFDAGEHRSPFSTSSLTNGMYCVVLTTSSESASAKVLVNH